MLLHVESLPVTLHETGGHAKTEHQTHMTHNRRVVRRGGIHRKSAETQPVYGRHCVSMTNVTNLLFFGEVCVVPGGPG